MVLIDPYRNMVSPFLEDTVLTSVLFMGYLCFIAYSCVEFVLYSDYEL